MKLVILLLLPLYCAGQVVTDTSDFKKYSYRIFGVLPISTEDTLLRFNTGTGFFFRKKGQLFLISAKHVITGCNTAVFPANMEKIFPNTMFVQLSDKPSDLLPINVKSIRDTASCQIYVEEPDIIVIAINDTIARKVQSIENMYLPSLTKPCNILMSGFPASAVIENGYIKTVLPTTLYWQSDKYNFKQVYVVHKSADDQINLRIKQNQYPAGNPLRGFSGSPLYAQDSATKKWQIAGVFVTTDRHAGAGYLSFVKFEYAIERINQYLQFKESK